MRPGCHVARQRRGVAAVGVAAVLALAGCGGGGSAVDDPLRRRPGEVYFYGTDGNMSNGVGALVSQDHAGVLAGMKGTLPLTRLSQSFRDRLRTVDPTLVDDLYAGETYDAVVISALAAAIAGTTDPTEIAEQVNGVTAGGVACDTPAQCLALVEDGTDIRYRGITLGLGGFTDAGEPSATTYGIMRFGADNQILTGLTQFVPAGDARSVTQAAPPAGVGSGSSTPLRIGALLPHTGALASAGPPMFAGGLLAIDEINEAGGILGHDVVWVDGDDGTDGEVALATVERLIDEENVHVIIGAGASGISLAVLPTVVAAGVVMISPCNTADVLSTYDDHGLYFRTAPPDVLQAAALADIIVRDGTRSLAIVYRDDAYGTGLAEATRQKLVQAGLDANRITLQAYVSDPLPADYGAIAQAVRTQDPDGVLIVSFDETREIIDALVGAGITSIVN